MRYISCTYKEPYVALVTITREEAMNALNVEMIEELDEVFRVIAESDARAVVLMGGGQKAFVAGADIGEMAGMNTREARAFSRRGNQVFLGIERFPVPVIATVRGFALGGGCELALCCDFRLASADAVFAQPEAGLGITPGYGGTQRLARLIGAGRAKEMIYTGRKVRAEEAKAIGLVNEIYGPEELLPKAMELAGKIAQNAPAAVRACKKAINEGLNVPLDQGIEIESELFSTCFSTLDQKRAMTAFVEKRPHEPFEDR